jgi:AraC-like DNA-binding protein
MDVRKFVANIDTRDADEAAEFLSSIFRPVQVAPLEHKGLIDLQASGWRHDGWAILRAGTDGGFTLHPRESCEAIIIMMLAAGRIDIPARARHLVATTETGLIVDAVRFSKVALSAHLSELALMISKDEIVRHLAALLDAPAMKPISFAPNFDMTGASGNALLSIARMLANGMDADQPLSRAPLAVRQLSQSMIALLIESFPHNYSDALDGRAPVAAPRQVKRAIEYMEANAARPITIADVAAAANVSVRSLQAAFRSFKGTSPFAYLRQLRLDAVRRDLLTASPPKNVAATAHKWGFAHLGRFAHQYRQHFGERPSDTVARAEKIRRGRERRPY